MPQIVAESLRDVDEPLETVLRAGPAASPAAVARAIAQSLLPAESSVPVPAWLRPDQRASFRRCLAALERHGGALLADPVGSGKTWIALAVAGALGEVTAAIVPAALLPQWRATAGRLSIRVRLTSHEAISRGQLPDQEATFALVDECHRFRNPATRRYASLARWLVGRRALLMSGTPVVNRLEDLAHQLLLSIRDDALRTRGVGSLLDALRGGVAHPALGELVLSRSRPADTPGIIARDLPHVLAPEETALVRDLRRLRLSRQPGIAALVRLVLGRALASSPAALAGTLDRYLALLDQARAAAGSGRRVSRAAIRAWCGADAGQYLMWEVLPDSPEVADLCPGDRARVLTLLVRARQQALLGDARSRALHSILADGRRSIVFTGSRDTLDFLREQWRDLRPAWVTGDAAGIGNGRLARAEVLSWFQEECRALPPPLRPPSLLLATDVAAEGLDLQRAERVVHYDLPWTSVRLDQREGRARRLGGACQVETVRCLPDPELEQWLRSLARLARKRDLTFIAGLGDEARWLYRWRADLASWAGAGTATPGIAVIAGPTAGWLVGVAFDSLQPDGSLRTEPAELLWFGSDGTTDAAPERLVPMLQDVVIADSDGADAALTSLRPRLYALVRRRLQEASARRLGDPVAHRRVAVLRRLRRLAVAAARLRDATALARLDQLIPRLAGGLTAGEERLVAEAAGAEDLMRALTGLLAAPERMRHCPVPRLTGIVRVATFPACPDSARFSSISMAP